MNVNEEINFLCWVNKVTNKTGAVKVVDAIGVESFNERQLNTAEVVINKNRYSLYAN